MSLDESSFVGLKFFFRIEIIRVLFDLVSFSFFAVVNAFLQIVFYDVHFGDDALHSYQLVG